MCKKIKYLVLVTLFLTGVTKPEGNPEDNTVASLASALGIGFGVGCATGMFPPIGPMLAVPTVMCASEQTPLEQNVLLGSAAVGIGAGVGIWYKAGQYIGNRFFASNRGRWAAAVPVILLLQLAKETY